MSISVIKLFNKAFKSDEVSFSEINKLAVKVGYIVHPHCCSNEVLQFLKSLPINLNATFYKSWSDIINKNRFELYIDQIKHYASTYGTDFKGEVWTSNEGSEQPDYSDFKVITPITIEEVNNRCCDMLYSGIALNENTLKMVLELITDIDVERVKNKEAMMSLHKKFGTVPKDNVEFVRFLVFLATKKTLSIKDKDTLAALKIANIDLPKLVENFGIEKLAEVFFRFKPVFLSLGKIKGNKAVVNRLRRLADKYHKPMKIGFFENILSLTTLPTDLQERLKECSNYKKVTLLQTILIRKKQLDMRFFGIRNGKLWAKEEKSKTKNYYDELYAYIYQSLITSLSTKACRIKLPLGVKITLPTSEKSFVGNYPLGTSFDLSNTDSIIGIHWRSSEGAIDLDLSLHDIDCKKYGWNADYTNEQRNVIYSGDQTTAYPEAVELFYGNKGMKPSIVKVNRYGGEDKAKFRVFLATETIVEMEVNYMVNPNNILFMIDCEMSAKEKTVGVITGDKFILAEFKTGNKIVSGNSITNKYTEYALSTLDCYLDLEKVLIDAGFTINSGNESIDLTNLSKDTLINLLS
jgi:hypothetical protein